MREILFRGKRLDNGELVCGTYYKQTENYGDPVEKHFIIATHENLDYDQALEYFEVDPATIGQYTGVDDIFCKRIFEGDLCLCDRHINDVFDKKVFEIRYDPINGFYGENFDEIDAWEFCMCEIVGNIYDNPELLKGE